MEQKTVLLLFILGNKKSLKRNTYPLLSSTLYVVLWRKTFINYNKRHSTVAVRFHKIDLLWVSLKKYLDQLKSLKNPQNYAGTPRPKDLLRKRPTRTIRTWLRFDFEIGFRLFQFSIHIPLQLIGKVVKFHAWRLCIPNLLHNEITHVHFEVCYRFCIYTPQ